MLLVMEHGNQSLSDRFPLVAVVEMSVGLLMLGAGCIGGGLLAGGRRDFAQPP